jgi:hypothetical protein
LRSVENRLEDPSHDVVDWEPTWVTPDDYLNNIFHCLKTIPLAHSVFFHKRDSCSPGLELQSAMFDLSTIFGLFPDFRRRLPRFPGPQWYDFEEDLSSDDEEDNMDGPRPPATGPRLNNRQYYAEVIQLIENNLRFYRPPRREDLWCYRNANGSVSRAFATQREVAKHCWTTFGEDWRTRALVTSMYRS